MSDDLPAIAFVRVQRYDTPDMHTYAAVRADELAAVLAASDRAETVQQCDLELPPDIAAALAARLAAPLRPVRAVIGDVTGDTWATGSLTGQRRPRFWEFRPKGKPLPPGYRCTYIGSDGHHCDMIGEALRQCPAHTPGTRFELWSPDDGDEA